LSFAVILAKRGDTAGHQGGHNGHGFNHRFHVIMVNTSRISYQAARWDVETLTRRRSEAMPRQERRSGLMFIHHLPGSIPLILVLILERPSLFLFSLFRFPLLNFPL
jgi:hypothetical protein